MTTIACKKFKKLANKEYENTELNKHGEFVVKSSFFDDQHNLEIRELNDENSTARVSSTTKRTIYQNKDGKTHPGGLTVHEEATLPRLPLPYVPKPPPPYAPKSPPPCMPKPPPILPPTQSPNLKQNLPPKVPPKVFSPGSSLLQSDSQTEPQDEDANTCYFTSISFGGKKDKEKKKKNGCKTGKFGSTAEVPMHQNKSGDADSNTVTLHKEATIPPKSPPELPPKPPPELPPKPPPVSSSRQSPKSSCNSKAPSCHNNAGRAYSTTVFFHKEDTLPKPPPEMSRKPQHELPPRPPPRSASIQPPKLISAFKGLISHNKCSTAHSSTEVPTQNSTFLRPVPELAPVPIHNVCSVQSPTSKPKPPPKVKGKAKPDPPPKAFSLKSSLSPSASNTEQQHHFATTSSSVSEGAKKQKKKNVNDTNSVKMLSSAFESPVCYSSLSETNSSTLNPPKQAMLSKPIVPPKLPSKITSDLLSPVSSLSSASRETVQQHQTATIPSSSLDNASRPKKEDVNDTNSKTKCSAFYSPLYKSSAGDLHSSTSTPRKRAIFPKLLSKPPLDVPPGEVPAKVLEKRDLKNANSTMKLSSAIKSSLCNSSAGELASSTLVPDKQALLHKPKFRTLPSPSIASECSFAQSGSQNIQKNHFATNTSTSTGSAVVVEKGVLKGNEPISRSVTGYDSVVHNKSGTKSFSSTSTSCQPTVLPTRRADLSPKPTASMLSKQPLKPQSKVSPPKPSSVSPLATQIHLQDQSVIEVYDEPISLLVTANKQPPHSEMNGYSALSLGFHGYDEVSRPAPAKKALLPHYEQI